MQKSEDQKIHSKSFQEIHDMMTLSSSQQTITTPINMPIKVEQDNMSPLPPRSSLKRKKESLDCPVFLRSKYHTTPTTTTHLNRAFIHTVNT